MHLITITIMQLQVGKYVNENHLQSSELKIFSTKMATNKSLCSDWSIIITKCDV